MNEMKIAKGAFVINNNHDANQTLEMSADTYAKSAYLSTPDGLIPAVALFRGKGLRAVLTTEDAIRVASKIADIVAEHRRLAA